MFQVLLRDLRYALRRLANTPLFSAITILTLSLALGAAGTVFSVMNGVLVQPLPYRNPERLVMVWNDFGQGAQSLPAVSSTDYLDYRTETTLFEGFAAGAGQGEVRATGILTGDGPPERVQVTPVSSNLLPLFGVEPMLGRQFTEAEEAFQGPKVVMLSHRLWQRRYNADPAVVGQTIQMDGVSYQVVGVLPRNFRLELPAEVYQIKSGDIWTPLQFDRAHLPPRNLTTFTAFGKLKPGVTLAQAQAEMDGLAAKFRATYPEHQGSQVRIRLIPLKQDVVKAIRPGILALLGAVCALVIIACANIANLLLTRAAGRAREFGIRAAIGAGKIQLLRQLLIEGAVLTAIGGAIGLGLTFMALRLLPHFGPAGLPRIGEIGVDWQAALFTALLCFAVTIVFGLAPALHAFSSGANDLIRSGTRVVGRRRGAVLTQLLVGAEIALTLTLLIGAGLLIQSFFRLKQVNPGFDPRGAVSFRLALPATLYPNPPARTAFYDEADRRLGALPGVVSVGRASQLPLTGSGSLAPYAYDEATARNWESVTAEGRNASPDYFRAIGTRLLSGRFFTREDVDRLSQPGTRDIIIDETLARKVWPNGNAVGEMLQIQPTGEENNFARVIGVVEYTRIRELAADGLPQIYWPQWPAREASYVVRTTGSTDALAQAIQREIAAINPDLALSDLGPMEESVARSLDSYRLSLILMQGVAGLALLLGTIGVYGVIAESVGQRQREFGVRVVLGESPGRLERRVILEGARLVVPSLAVGIALAIGAARIMQGIFYGVSSADAATFAVVSGLLLLVATAACYLPARRAARTDPLVVLRGE